MKSQSLRHILLVEDEDDHVELIARSFEALNLHPPQLARTIQEARQAINVSVPDLMIVDLTLPDGKGIELLPATKDDAVFPIIILSGRGDEAIAVESIKRGALDYVVKSNESFATIPKLIEHALREWDLILDHKRMMHALQESERRLRQAKKMEALGTLAGGIAHDFNNILSAILGYTQLACIKAQANKALQDDLSQIQQAGDRAKHLVQQILAFGRQSIDKRQPAGLRGIITEILQLLRPTLPATIEVQTHLFVAKDTALVDSSQIHQVLVNLCANAENGMRETGGILKIGLQETYIEQPFAAQHPPLQTGNHLAITISDTGPGIPLEILDRIFDPFFTTKDTGEGTGLGLSVAHGIITQHEGAITVSSQIGQGATFTVYLQQIEWQEQAPSANQPLDASLQGTGRILFIDDEEQLVILGQKILESYGYEVIPYTSSLEAFSDFQSSPDRYDAIITDQTMPQITGEALARKALKIRPDIPIILLTGFSHTITAETARSIGVDAFLLKPLLPQQLGTALKKALTRSRKKLP